MVLVTIRTAHAAFFSDGLVTAWYDANDRRMSHCLASSAAASASGFHDQASAARIRRSRVSSNAFQYYKQPSAGPAAADVK